MDGHQEKMKQSLQFRLSVWIAAVITVLALAAGIFSFAMAFQDANELQDDQLRQIAIFVNNSNLQASSKEDNTIAATIDPESRVIVQFMPRTGTMTSEPLGNTLELPPNLPDGIQTVTAQGDSWRIFIKPLDNGLRVVVGQHTSVRDDIAQDSAWRTLLPFLILIPALLLLVSILIRQMFKPVKQLAHDLDQRPQQDLRAIVEADVPSEIRPFVVAINGLLSRVAKSMELQRRFLADAAHELRSPLTALSLQAERLASSDLSNQARQRLDTLQSGLHRSRQLLDQLLALARAQESDKVQAPEVSVRRVAHQVIEDLMPLAQAKNIDLGMVSDQDICLTVPEIDLKTLVKNLLDNAIRYTPCGGKIDLHIQIFLDKSILEIEDSGPGIPEEERGRVFDPFYRILGNDEVGSGLGLSIVKTIADRLEAIVTLGYVQEAIKIGLRVSVEFPTPYLPTNAP
jgi:two-component system OmpR family sensor kinase